MSIPETSTSGNKTFIIKAIHPDPVPISKMPFEGLVFSLISSIRYSVSGLGIKQR